MRKQLGEFLEVQRERLFALYVRILLRRKLCERMTLMSVLYVCTFTGAANPGCRGWNYQPANSP